MTIWAVIKAVRTGTVVFKAVAPVKRIRTWKEKRTNKKRAKKGLPPISLDVNKDVEVDLKMKGYKTVVFNIIMGIVMLVKVLGGDASGLEDVDVSGAIDIVEAGLVTLWSVGNIILRAITSTKIFNRS